MTIRSTIIGIASAFGVLVVMVAARLLVSQVEPPEVLKLREIEIATLQDPPPPPPPPPPEEPVPTPPPPALTSLSNAFDPTRVPLPKVDVPQSVDIPIDPFNLDITPSPLPAPPGPPVASKPAPRQSASRPKPAASKPKPRPQPAPVAKSHYGMSELDGRPRLIRHPSVVFPRALAARGIRAGTVTLEVELNTSGRVSVRRVVSATHQELIPKARYIAQGSRFTPPKRRGQPVKAIMRWPITIKQ